MCKAAVLKQHTRSFDEADITVLPGFISKKAPFFSHVLPLKESIHQLNKTELLACVAPGWRKTEAQFLNLIDSFGIGLITRSFD